LTALSVRVRDEARWFLKTVRNRRRTGSWWRAAGSDTSAAGAALAHLLEPGFLLGRQNLVQPGIDFLLNVRDLPPLGVAQVQYLFEETRQDLARLGRSAAAWTAGRPIAAEATAAGHVFPLIESDKFLARDDAVLVRIGSLEEPQQAGVGDLVVGEFAILVFVEGHHFGDEAVNVISAGIPAAAGRLSR
jgi:hypothetical protein